MTTNKDLNKILKGPDDFVLPKEETTFVAEYMPHDKNQSIIKATTNQDLRGKGDKELRDFIISQGGVVPEGYRVRLVEVRHQTHGWTRSKNGKDALTKPTFWYRFLVEPISNYINMDELIKEFSKKKSIKKSINNKLDYTMTVLFADFQLGKIDDEGEGLGVEKTLSKFKESVNEALVYWRKNGKPNVHLAFAGDCIEGFSTSQNGRLTWRQSLTLTEQLRLFRWMLKHSIDTFVDAGVNNLEIDVVNGNHDTASSKYTSVETRPDDGYATESAIAVNEALRTNNERYKNVTIYVPKKDQDHIVRKVGSSIITVIHGHQWSKGKSFDWLSGQSLNKQPSYNSQIILHGHEHEHSVKTKKTRWIICGAPFEVSSNWWKAKTGDESKRGAIAFLHKDGEVKYMTLI